MKKVTTLALCAGLASAAMAQKNSILVMGGIGFDANTSEGTGPTTSKRTLFNFTPGVGYQVSDHWTLGVLGEFTTSNQKMVNTNVPASTSSNRQFGGGFFGRYSTPITSLLFFVAQADATYTTNAVYNNGVKVPGSSPTSFLAKLYPAIGMHIKQGFALNLGFGNVDFRHTNDPGNKATQSGVNVNMFRGFNFAMTKNIVRHKTKEPANLPMQG